jgi:hypothetical protein
MSSSSSPKKSPSTTPIAPTFSSRFRTKLRLIHQVLRTPTSDSLVLFRIATPELEAIQTGSEEGHRIVTNRLGRFTQFLGCKGCVLAIYPTESYKDNCFINGFSFLPSNHVITREIDAVAKTVVKFYVSSNEHSNNDSHQ